MGLTCNKAIYFYSMSGNTKALVEKCDTTDYDLYNMALIKPEDLSFGEYETLFIGTSTVGRGVPHTYFREIYGKLISLENRNIGLFGSGNSIYDVYCGALDVLEELLSSKNNVILKFKFESYPTKNVLHQFQEILRGDK
ncbi:flavodoxin family protein [Paenibacillus sp. JSM ZJ436]